ncbi:MAG: type II toxin-antitoxin system VapC family toxin [Verrucomicrobia bacterium]|nr:type II toxin-antitoxin system VapC family toxin [Verrucomicrobiota bacterium]
MSRFLLDSSFVIDLLNEVAANRRGPARAWAARRPGAELWISPVTAAEVLEGAADEAAVREVFRAFRWQTIGHQHAERAALRQSRAAQRMGENDAWQVAVAECMDAVIVGHDPRAFDRLGAGYEDHRRS